MVFAQKLFLRKIGKNIYLRGSSGGFRLWPLGCTKNGLPLNLDIVVVDKWVGVPILKMTPPLDLRGPLERHFSLKSHPFFENPNFVTI